VFTTAALAAPSLSLGILQVGATIGVAALSWRFIEEPIRHGALGTFWKHVRAGRWQVVPRRSWGALAGAVGILVLAGCELSGMPGNTQARSSHASQPSSIAPAVTHPSSGPWLPALLPWRTQSERTAGPLQTACHSVAYIGDSTSEGMISPNYLPNRAQRLPARLKQVGVTSQRIRISGARSIVETLSGQTNGYGVAKQLKATGFRGCWIIALGTNDTANVYVGSPVGRLTRIQRMMSVIGEQRVLWVNVKSLLGSGPYSETDMRLWDRGLLRACAAHPNMRIFDWASVAKKSWFISDGTHYTSQGYARRARATADAVAHAFPASGTSRHRGCLVR
jgi:lysophospholipase L1-like esterase